MVVPEQFVQEVQGLQGGQPLLMVVPEQFVQEVQGLRAHEVLVLAVHKSLPSLSRVTSKDVRKSGIELNLVFVQVFVELLCSENLGYPDQLVVVVMTVEERLLPEDHTCQHTPKAPHIQAIVVHLVIH